MKLIVQVPCYNEEATLPLVINSIPKFIRGVDEVETMIVDDGSKDKTVKVAKKLGVTHIIRNKQNRGLAATFATGLHEALKRGADIIVNTDGDNQYPQQDIPKLIQPILDGKYDIVVADRQTGKVKEFSVFKKIMQRFGSRVVNLASGTDIPDAPSGFRAYSRTAAMNINIITDFSYCMETIISAGRKRIAITHIPVKTNPKTRESRLFKNVFQHMAKSGSAIIRSYTMYQPFKIFLFSGIVGILVGLIPIVRFIVLRIANGDPLSAHIQSMLFGSILFFLGVMFIVIGIVADLLSINRKLLEDSLYRMKKLEYDGGPLKKKG
jgi:glycosyltransferase involved in cell wall biosynthesis